MTCSPLLLISMRSLFHRVFSNAVGDNSWYLCLEIFWAAVYGSAQTFAGAYAIRLGATNSEVSLLTSIPPLTAALILLPAGQFLKSRDRRKNWLLSSLFVIRAGTLLFVLLPWLNLGSVSPGALFVVIFALLTIPTHFFNLGFIPFLAQVVPEPHRADTFAARNMLAGAMTSVCNFLFGIWLGWVAFPGNYQAMFLFGFGISMLSLYYLSKVNIDEARRIPPSQAASPARTPLPKQWSILFSAPWKVSGFRRIFINTLLHSIGLWAATPLYLLYFVRTLGASEAWLGLFGSVGGLSTIFGYLFWRRIIYRWGEPKTLQWTIVAVGLYPLLTGSVPSLIAILLIAGLNGLIAPGVNLSHFNTFLKVIPEEEHHNYTALYLTLLNIGAFICPTIGIALANQYGFAPVLMACGLLSIVGSTSFWLWPVVETSPAKADLTPESRRT